MKATMIVLCITGFITLVLGRIGYDNYPLLWLAGLQFAVAGLINLMREKSPE